MTADVVTSIAAGARRHELRLHRRVVAGDRAALLELFDRLGHVVYCAALGQVLDQRRAEEMTQSVFLELWRRPSAFDPRRGPIGLQLLQILPTLTTIEGSAPVEQADRRPREPG